MDTEDVDHLEFRIRIPRDLKYLNSLIDGLIRIADGKRPLIWEEAVTRLFALDMAYLISVKTNLPLRKNTLGVVV